MMPGIRSVGVWVALLSGWLTLNAHSAVAQGRSGMKADHAFSLATLRRLYAQAARDEDAQRRFYNLLHGHTSSDAVVVAYGAVAEALQARVLWSPLAKLRAVRTAQAGFARATALDSANVEVRFLRYTVESNVPRYLRMSPHLAADRRIVLAGARHYRDLGLDAESLRQIRDFMLLHGECTPEEARMLRELKP